MTHRKINHFDLAQICRSGQCFRMTEGKNGKFFIIAGDRYLEAKQDGDACEFSCSDAEFESFWENYFDLKTDYQKFKNKIDAKDTYLFSASNSGGGIRILRQEPWETTVSFLISQQNNIVRIRRCIRNICEKYGERKISENGVVYHAFPKPEALAALEEDELMKCNLGYRSKYVVRCAKVISEGGFSLDALLDMPYKEAKEELLKLYGVGVKVADCICLFALHKLEAFPVDTHIRQALSGHYPQGFPFERYEGFQGVMQQYIFYLELCGK